MAFPHLDATTYDRAEVARWISDEQEFEKTWVQPFGVLCAIHLAERLGVWNALTREDDAHSLHKVLGIRPKVLDCLIEILVNSGMLTRTPEGRLSGSALTRRVMTEQGFSPHLRPAFHFFEFIVPHLGAMERAARGETIDLPMGWPPRTEAEAELFEPMMSATSALAVSWLDELVDFSRHSTLSDVGCGDGNMAASLCRKYPGLKAVLLNLPHTRSIVERTVALYDVEGRAQFHPFDLTKEEFSNASDAILFSRMLSDWPDAVVASLFYRAASSLAAGGRIYILDTAPSRTQGDIHPWTLFWELFVPGFDLNGPRDVAELEALARQNGFTLVRSARYEHPPLENLLFIELERAR